jgi:hypothetical protein
MTCSLQRGASPSTLVGAPTLLSVLMMRDKILEATVVELDQHGSPSFASNASPPWPESRSRSSTATSAIEKV